MQPEKQTNRASIIFAILTIVFILAGVYMLNEVFSPDRSSSSTTQVATTTPEERLIPTIPEEEETEEVVESEPIIEVEEEPVVLTPEPEPVETETTPEPETQPEQSSFGPTGTQFTAELTSIAGNETSWTIDECGPSTGDCTPGFKIRLIFGNVSNLIEGNTYVMTGTFTKSASQTDVSLSSNPKAI